MNEIVFETPLKSWRPVATVSYSLLQVLGHISHGLAVTLANIRRGGAECDGYSRRRLCDGGASLQGVVGG